MLEQSDTALSQDMIEQQMKGEMDRVTIYRVLNSFCEDGITHKIMSDDGKNYYALCNGCNENHIHDHVHFKCLNCMKVECMKEDVIVQLPTGYRAVHMNCWVSGYCDSCMRSRQ